jgi:hypothetical protein
MELVGLLLPVDLWYYSVFDICTLPGYYTALSGSYVPTFWDNLSVPSSRVKKPSSSSWTSWLLRMVPIYCPETSVENNHSTARNVPVGRRSHLHRGGCLKSRTVCFFLTRAVHRCRTSTDGAARSAVLSSWVPCLKEIPSKKVDLCLHGVTSDSLVLW